MTEKQKSVINQMIGNNGKKSLTDIVRDANYSPSLIDNPNRVIQSPTIQQALERVGLTDNYIAGKHKKLVDSKDQRVSYQGVDMYYKVKGLYKGDINLNINNYNQIIEEISE